MTRLPSSNTVYEKIVNSLLSYSTDIKRIRIIPNSQFHQGIVMLFVQDEDFYRSSYLRKELTGICAVLNKLDEVRIVRTAVCSTCIEVTMSEKATKEMILKSMLTGEDVFEDYCYTEQKALGGYYKDHLRNNT